MYQWKGLIEETSIYEKWLIYGIDYSFVLEIQWRGPVKQKCKAVLLCLDKNLTGNLMTNWDHRNSQKN